MGEGAAPLERGDELSLLERAMGDARGDTGGAVVVEGVAGIGKTALLRALRRTVDDDVQLLAARGSELEGDFAFGVVRQLLGPALEDASEAEREQLLEGAAAPALPLFATSEPGVTPADAALDHGYDVLHALHLIVARLAAKAPLLIEVDDAHWADVPSLRFLAFLAHRIDAIPALMVLGMRTGAEWSAPELHAALTADPAVPIIRPRPLSTAATAELAAGSVQGPVDDGFAAACHEASGGNPFYLRALLREAAERGIEPTAAHADDVKALGPDAVRRSVLARLRRLPPHVGAFARAAAVLGERAPQRIVAQLADLEGHRAAEAADALRSVGILEPGLGIGFEHPILRSAVYDLGSPSERAAAHGRAAALLRASGAEADVVAAQLLLAEPEGSADAVEDLRVAARAASARGAPDVAAVYLRRALHEPPTPAARGHVLLDLGMADSLRRSPEAREELVEAIELVDEPSERLRAAVALWTNDSFDGRYGESLEVLERTLGRTEGANADLRLRVELEVARGLRMSLATATEGREAIAKVRERPWSTRTVTERLALALIALDDLFVNAPADGLADLAERALPLSDALLEGHESQLVHIPFYALIYCDRIDRARALLDSLIQVAARRGSRIGVEIGSLWRSLAHLRAGALADAELDARRVLDGLIESRWRFGEVAARHFLAEALLDRGDLDEARRLFGSAEEVRAMPRRAWTNHVRYGRARVAMASGDPAEALEELLLVGRLEDEFAAERPSMVPWRSQAALAAGAVGEDKLAKRLSTQEVKLARAFGAPRTLGMALRAHGLVVGGKTGHAALEEAVTVLAPSPARLEHGRALIDLGAQLRRDNQRAAARERLREGLELASDAGARALAERARDELRASGARLRRERVSGVHALTGSELRVAQIAADGATNPEIAQALFVSRKTVEKHLANAYMKLDIASRDDLAAALAKE